MLCAASYLLWKRAGDRRAAAAFAACLVKAEQGDAKSQYELGRMYFYGLGVQKDRNAWAEWCRKAAEQGYARAETQLGNSYYYCWGVDRDFDQALLWYHKAAVQGEPEAEKNIGYAYSHGNGVAKDYVQAVHWYRLSADKGYASAEYNLGNMYSGGFGVPRDLKEASPWYRKAAEHGDANAQIMLGLRERPFTNTGKFIVGVELVGSLLLFFNGMGSVRIGQPRHWNTQFVAGLLGLIYVVVNVYSRSSLAVFRSPVPLDLLVMAKGLTAGLSVAVLLDIVLPKQQWRSVVKFCFGLVGVVLLLNSLFWGVFAILGRIPAGSAVNVVRHVCSLDAFLFGWAIALGFFLRWKKGQPNDNGPTELEASGEMKAES